MVKITGQEPPLALLGRAAELATLTVTLDKAAAGSGSAILLRGEAGIGKTALLAAAKQLAAGRGMRLLTCSGVRSEAHLPFAGPLLVVADDVHWLDRPSADVLAFASRRVAAEPIAMILAVRDGADHPLDGAGLTEFHVGSLDPASARELLDQAAPHLPGDMRGRVLAAADGNPLALVELPAGLPPDTQKPAGPLPDRLPVGDLLRRSFTRRLSELPAQTQTLLLVASADPSRSLSELCAAAEVLGSPVTEADIQPAIDARLVRPTVTPDHPLRPVTQQTISPDISPTRIGAQ